MRKYEFVLIFDSTLDDAAVAEGLEKYCNLVREQGGEISQQENWGRRKFAYDIRHKSEGSYLYIRFRGEKKVVDEINRVLRFDERVLRTLIVLDDDAEARNAEAQRREGRQPADHAASGGSTEPLQAEV